MHKNNSECSKIASKILNFTENQGWRVHEGNRRYRESNGKLCKEILLFKTTDIGIVKYCQNIFTFMLPSARLSRLKTRFLASYSSVDNSVCRHILIYSWLFCFCLYTLIVLVLLHLFVYFLLFTTRFMVNISIFIQICTGVPKSKFLWDARPYAALVYACSRSGQQL